MTQVTNYDIENNTAAAVRADIQAAFQALNSSNSGTSAPSNPVEGMFWFDTDANPRTLSIYSNGAWEILCYINADGLDLIVNDFNAGTTSGFDFINSTGVSRMTLDSSGNLACDGSITAGGNVTAYSDERLKDNIKTLDGNKVYQMRGVSFTKDGMAGSGVIAQELAKVAPELVDDTRDYMSVAYGNIVGYLIEAIKDLKSEVEQLKAGEK